MNSFKTCCKILEHLNFCLTMVLSHYLKTNLITMHVNQHIGFPSLGHKFYGPTLNFPNISIFTTHTTFVQLQAKTISLIIRKILQSINQSMKT